MKTVHTPTLPDPLRRKLMFALPGGLALASPMALVGCGGGGGDGGGPAPANDKLVQAQMVMPAAMLAADVTIVSHAEEVQPAGDGKFSVAVGGTTLSMLCAVHSSDRALLFGLYTAGSSGQKLDARSSAATLLFFALGGSQLSAAARQTLHALIVADAQTTVLAATIQTQLDADPFALDHPGIPIADAVKQTVQAWRVLPAAAGSTRSRRLADAVVQPMVLIEPGGEVNGISVNQENDPAGFSIVNTKRRRGVARVYQTGFEVEGASPVMLTPPFAKGAALEIESTQALGVVTALSDIVKGTAPFSPVTTPKVALAMEAGADKTFYDIVYLAPLYDAPEPAFFSQARYASNVDIWREDLADLHRRAQLELVFGAVLEALGFGGVAISTLQFNEALTAMRAAATTDVIELLAQAGLGKGLLPGFRAWLVSVSTGNAIVSGAYRVGVATLLRGAEAQFAANLAAGNLSQARLLAFHGAIRIMLAVTVVAGVIDTAAQWRDLTEGEKGSLFTAKLVAPKVLVSPSSGKVGKGQEQVLTARVTGAGNATLSYRWTLTGSSLANLSDKLGQIGATIDTDSASVTLATTPSTVGTLTITVEAFEVTAAGKRSLGTATSTLEMDDSSVTLTPASARIERVGGSQLFKMSVTPTPVEPVSYDWSCASQWGALTSGGAATSAAEQTITSTQATATYAGRADLDGGESESLTCVAKVMREDPATGIPQVVVVGSDSAEVSIKQKFNVELASLPGEVPADNTFAVVARITDVVPAGATIEWSWLHGGVGSITTSLADANKPDSSVQFSSGASEGLAIFTVSARVTVPGQPAIPVLPVTASTNVKKGLRKLTLPGYWVLEPGVIPQDPVCGIDGAGKQVCVLGHLDTWITYVVPKVPNAASGLFTVYRPDGFVLAQIPMTHPNLVDGGNVWRWRYWALNSVYGSYDGVPDLEKVQADAIAYLLFRVRTDGPTTAGVYTLKP